MVGACPPAGLGCWVGSGRSPRAGLTVRDQPGSSWGMTGRRRCACRPTAKCRPGTDDGQRPGGLSSMVYQPGAPKGGRRPRRSHVQEVSGLLGQAGPTSINLPPVRRHPRRGRGTRRPRRGAGPGGPQHRGGRPSVDLRRAGRPFGSVIGPLAVWLTRRDQDPFIDQAGREALNFGISIAIYGLLLLVAALMLVGIPFLMVGVVAWVVLASLACRPPARSSRTPRPGRSPL